MCGIIGYTGTRPSREFLLRGLERLEYRGYDSAGYSTVDADGRVDSVRAVGNLAALRAKVGALVGAGAGEGAEPGTGIAHTRWATHGSVCERNAHPHTDVTDRFHIVLNGIVENHVALRRRLEADGATFSSDTDAEVVAHLVAEHYNGDLALAARAAYEELEGHYAFVVLAADEPGTLVAMRHECPLVVGVADHGHFLASSVAAFLASTKRVHDVEDGEVVIARPDGVVFLAAGDPRPFTKAPVALDWDEDVASKGGHDSFLAKEIAEQPAAIAQTLAGRLSGGAVDLAELGVDAALLAAVTRIRVVACGTSYHSALVGQHLIERWARVPVDVEVASEWRYRDPLIADGELVVGVTQSGETADTLAAMRLARTRGATVLAVTNVQRSQATREADAVLFTRAGIEVSVAATKTFTSQVTAFATLALALAQVRGALDAEGIARLAGELERLPQLVARTVESTDAEATRLARRFRDSPLWVFLGRQAGAPIAMEGALKLKEVTYRPAEAYPAGELKHGPIALIAPGTPVVCVATRSRVRDKVLSNIAEVRARGAEVIVIAAEDDRAAVEEGAAEVVRVATAGDPLLQAVLAVVPMQLLALRLAEQLHLNVDQPRNLAKTVTVE